MSYICNGYNDCPDGIDEDFETCSKFSNQIRNSRTARKNAVSRNVYEKRHK